jgi:hypothetical protein
VKTMSDEQIKAYFLGKLSEPEAEIFEIECASDAQLTEQAQMVERELIDDYLRANLPAPDRGLFQTNYLITGARHDKLQNAAHLWKIAEESAAPVERAAPSPFWQTLFVRNRAFQLSLVCLLLLFALCAVAFYRQTLSVDKMQVAEVRDTNQVPETEDPPVQTSGNQTIENPPADNPIQKSVSRDTTAQNKEREKVSNSPAKNQPEIKTISAPKIVKPATTNLATFVLLAGSLRSEGEQTVVIAPNVQTLNLLLSPSGVANNYKIYRAVVKTANEETIFTSPNLNALSFKIPADKLQNRTYIISLEGWNSKQEFDSIADYTIRVRR